MGLVDQSFVCENVAIVLREWRGGHGWSRVCAMWDGACGGCACMAVAVVPVRCRWCGLVRPRMVGVRARRRRVTPSGGEHAGAASGSRR